ncbi:hypothetical protein VKT23_015146 [Stygiomarasmius scandens]|uniref:Uncharacterized protein n=1 Tax=Marasmiellus scandens TaxID=2682957 RepID=A0ABR1J228_9AGAR
MPWIYLGQDQKELPEVVFNGFFNATDGYRDVRKDDTAMLIHTIGSNGASLLKNTGGLPLHESSTYCCP